MGDELDELKADYEALGEKLELAEGSGAAALARERRILRARIAELSETAERSMIDEMAARREAKAAVGRPPARRRKSR